MNGTGLHRFRATMLLCLALAASGPAWSDDAADPVVAQRGGTTLTASAVKAMLQSTDPDTRQHLQSDPAALAQFVRERLTQMAVADEAMAKKWDQRPDIAQRIEQARQTVIVESYLASVTQPEASYPTDADVQAAYEANKSRLIVPRQYHLAQIFVVVPPNAAKATEDEAQKKAADLAQQAAKPHADFASLARKSSDDQASASNGGDLGWLRDDQLVPAIRTSVSGMQEGAVGDPVRQADGWHVLKLLGTRPAWVAPLADVQAALVKALRQDRQTQNARAYVAALLRKDPIQLNEIQLSHLQDK